MKGIILKLRNGTARLMCSQVHQGE